MPGKNSGTAPARRLAIAPSSRPEQRRAKVKERLEIDPLHAGTVWLIDRLALEGNSTSGPMGVKAIVTYLNARRIFTRDGGRWGIGQLHRVLTRTTDIGQHESAWRSQFCS